MASSITFKALERNHEKRFAISQLFPAHDFPLLLLLSQETPMGATIWGYFGQSKIE
jgi:hypothetical protein